MVAEVFNLAGQVGASRVELSVWEFNQKAQEFFTSLGFSPLMRRMALELDEVADDRREAE